MKVDLSLVLQKHDCDAASILAQISLVVSMLRCLSRQKRIRRNNGQQRVMIRKHCGIGFDEVTQTYYRKVMARTQVHFRVTFSAERHLEADRVVNDVDSSNRSVEQMF
jgi:hypothetical protein